MNDNKLPFWKDCLMQIAAGGAAGDNATNLIFF